MSHSKTPTKTKLARAKSRAKRTAKPGTIPSGSTRGGTKQEAVLALLRRPEGASGLQIAEATGWAPHTVRGFLALLGKKGIQVTVLERVRQVGPNKEGAKGSYTVYRVQDAGRPYGPAENPTAHPTEAASQIGS